MKLGIDSKLCYSCEKVVLYENFSKTKVSKDGLSNYCKDCNSDYNKRRRINEGLGIRDGRNRRDKELYRIEKGEIVALNCGMCRKWMSKENFFKREGLKWGYLVSFCKDCKREYGIEYGKDYRKGIRRKD